MKLLFNLLLILLAAKVFQYTHRRRRHKPRATHLGIYFGGKRKTYMSLRTDQKVNAVVGGLSAAGKPVSVVFDSAPQWSVSDEAVASVTPAADGLSAELLGLAEGPVTLSVTGSVGGVVLAGSVDAQVTAAQAVSLSITLGEPEAQ